MIVVNGGPSIVNLEYLTVDEVESIEVYGTSRGTSRGTPGGFSLGRRGRSVPVTSATFSNVDRAAFENQTRICPRVVYAWLR